MDFIIEKKSDAEFLAHEHAKFIRELLQNELDSKKLMLQKELENKVELYKAGMIHGFKHGLEQLQKSEKK